MDYKALLEKTGILIAGIVKGLNEFTSQKTGKTYYSVDLEIRGVRFPVTVKLPENYNRSQLKEYELAKIGCIVRPGYENKGIELHAIA